MLGYDEDNEYDVEDEDDDEDDKDVLFGEMTRKMRGGGHKSKSALMGRHIRKRSVGNKKEASTKEANIQKKNSLKETKKKNESSSDGLLLLHLAPPPPTSVFAATCRRLKCPTTEAFADLEEQCRSREVSSSRNFLCRAPARRSALHRVRQ